MTYNLVDHAMLHCNAHRGCRSFIDGYSIEEWRAIGKPHWRGLGELQISRMVASRLHGWATGVSQGRHSRRLDFCPEHAQEATS